LNLGTRFRLRGVGCDAPGFYLILIAGQLCLQGSKHCQPGCSPRKPHQPTLMAQLIKWHTSVVNPWSKPWSNPTYTLVTLNVFRNFCRVLQNSPKYLNIYLYESCRVWWGTQLSCRLAFQIWRGKMWKTWSIDSTSCSLRHIGIHSWQASPAKSIEKHTIWPLWKL
jgi:hypothetical protein